MAISRLPHVIVASVTTPVSCIVLSDSRFIPLGVVQMGAKHTYIRVYNSFVKDMFFFSLYEKPIHFSFFCELSAGTPEVSELFLLHHVRMVYQQE